MANQGANIADANRDFISHFSGPSEAKMRELTKLNNQFTLYI